MWSALQTADAQELYHIHHVFVTMLQILLGKELWEFYRLQALHSNGLARANQASVGVSFCRDQLVKEMTNALDFSNRDVEKNRARLLRLYLAPYDALIQYNADNQRDTSITIRAAEKTSSHYPAVEATSGPE